MTALNTTYLLLGGAELVRPEYAVEMFRLLGGGKTDGSMGGPSNSQIAVLPGTTHFTILTRTDIMIPIIVPSLDTPVPGAR